MNLLLNSKNIITDKVNSQKIIKLSEIFNKKVNEKTYNTTCLPLIAASAISILMFFGSLIFTVSTGKIFPFILSMPLALIISVLFVLRIYIFLYFHVLKYRLKGYKVIFDKKIENLKVENEYTNKQLLFPLEIKNNKPVYKIINNKLYYKDEDNKEETLNIKDIKIDYTNKLENTGIYNIITKEKKEIAGVNFDDLHIEIGQTEKYFLKLPNNSLIIK